MILSFGEFDSISSHINRIYIIQSRKNIANKTHFQFLILVNFTREKPTTTLYAMIRNARKKTDFKIRMEKEKTIIINEKTKKKKKQKTHLM